MSDDKRSSYNVAVIFLHPACNMSCSFCITEDIFDAMTQEQALELLQTLKKENFKSIVFGGGEPFEWHGKLIELTKEAKRLGFQVQLGTNAVSLPHHYQTIESVDRFVLPLESATSSVHNRMRFYKNKHHQTIVDCLETLRSAKKSVTISTILTQINKDGLEDLAVYLKKLNAPENFIHAWHLYKFIPQGRGGSINAASLMISDEQYSKACESVMRMELPFRIYQRRDMYHSKSVDFFWYQEGRLQQASKKREKVLT
ncbi:MAG: radical SAM protein [Candidatus Omnitrophota bacterium]